MGKMKRFNTKRMTGYVFLAPAVVFILYATVIPFVWNFILSFLTWDGFSDMEFHGIQNYLTVFQDSAIIKSIGNSVYYALASTIGGLAIGILLATLVFQLAGKEGWTGKHAACMAAESIHGYGMYYICCGLEMCGPGHATVFCFYADDTRVSV